MFLGVENNIFLNIPNYLSDFQLNYRYQEFCRYIELRGLTLPCYSFTLSSDLYESKQSLTSGIALRLH